MWSNLWDPWDDAQSDFLDDLWNHSHGDLQDDLQNNSWGDLWSDSQSDSQCDLQRWFVKWITQTWFFLAGTWFAHESHEDLQADTNNLWLKHILYIILF